MELRDARNWSKPDVEVAVRGVERDYRSLEETPLLGLRPDRDEGHDKHHDKVEADQPLVGLAAIVVETMIVGVEDEEADRDGDDLR